MVVSKSHDCLFDIGKVLLDFDFESSLKKHLPKDYANPSAVLETLLARKDAFETGRIPLDSYVDWAMETMQFQGSHDDFYHAWRNIFTPNRPMWKLCRKLKRQGHRLLLFSNTSAIHCPWIFEAFPEFEIFDGSILSFETGFIKPEKAIYEYAISKYGLTPENTIYIDDLPANIATGQAFGFRAYLYKLNQHEAFEQWLAREINV